MPLSKNINYTVRDIYALPEGKRAELIDGTMYRMAPPSRRHQEIVGVLFFAVKQHIREKNGSCQPYMAPFAVFLDKDEDKTYVEPDLSVICDPQKLNDKGCWGAPDFVIEVVSPSSKRLDYYTKLVLYRDAGVREYWIVDPDRETVLVYLLEESDAPVLYRFTDEIRAGALEGLRIRLADSL